MLLEKSSVMANAEGAWYILKNTNEQRGDLCSNRSVLRLAKGGEASPKSRNLWVKSRGEHDRGRRRAHASSMLERVHEVGRGYAVVERPAAPPKTCPTEYH
jgi:hypothetical protein